MHCKTQYSIMSREKSMPLSGQYVDSDNRRSGQRARTSPSRIKTGLPQSWAFSLHGLRESQGCIANRLLICDWHVTIVSPRGEPGRRLGVSTRALMRVTSH